MARKIVYLKELFIPGSSPLSPIVMAGSGCAFVHSRPEMDGILNLDELNSALVDFAPFEVEGHDFSTFHAALSYATNHLRRKEMITMRDNIDDVVCYVMI